MTTQSKLRETNHTSAQSLAKEARALIDSASGIAEEKVLGAGKTVSKALKQGGKSLAALKGHAVQKARAADRHVRKHPYRTLTVAFGVGTAIGLMLFRRGVAKD